VPQALIGKDMVLLRNGWWVTQNAITHPTFRIKLAPFITGLIYFETLPGRAVISALMFNPDLSMSIRHFQIFRGLS
jgi:hypothetical protein